MKAFIIFGGFWGQNQFFLWIFETTILKQFSIQSLKISQNMCKLCHKVCNGQNLPNESPNFIKLFFSK